MSAFFTSLLPLAGILAAVILGALLGLGLRRVFGSEGSRFG